jgi:lipoprotein-anchoring transpeptidase ErfK/SrfK
VACVALLAVAAFVLFAIVRARQAHPPAGGPPSLPRTVRGPVAFSPPSAAAEVDPSQPVVVQTLSADATLKHVVLQQQDGRVLAGRLETHRFVARDVLKPDSTYTVTATAAVRSRDPAGAIQIREQTESSTFATSTTPRIASVSPPVVGPGQAVVVVLNAPASTVDVRGPVTAKLSPDRSSIEVLPAAYEQGGTYRFTITAKNARGTAGSPQDAGFAAFPPATAVVSPASGASNLGVAMPLTLTLSSPPADGGAFASRLHATVSGPPPAGGAGVPPGQTGPCGAYVSQASGGPDVALSVAWVARNKVRLTPRTPDGYWPANSSIALSGGVSGLRTESGSWFVSDISSSFVTGDERVIDVDLTTQTLTACRNGVQVNQFPVSSGARGHDTRTGRFFIYQRIADARMTSNTNPFAPGYYDIKHVPWTQYFDRGNALHGAWWHNNFGHPMSHGCVNVQTPTQNRRWPAALPQADFLWQFDSLGDPVVVHGVTPTATSPPPPPAPSGPPPSSTPVPLPTTPPSPSPTQPAESQEPSATP